MKNQTNFPKRIELWLANKYFLISNVWGQAHINQQQYRIKCGTEVLIKLRLKIVWFFDREWLDEAQYFTDILGII